MYIHQCTECGKQDSTQERVNRVKCPYCGAETNVSYADQEQQQQFSGQPLSSLDSVFTNGPSGKSRGVAAILALFFGAIGLHYFYIGKTNAGILFLVASILSCGALAVVTQIVSFVQGILFLVSTQEEFEMRWVNAPSSVPLF